MSSPKYLVLVQHPDNPDSHLTAFSGTDRALAERIMAREQRAGRVAILVEVVSGPAEDRS